MQPDIKQDSSNTPEKSAVETQSFDNLNVPMVNDEDGREISKSYQAIKGESETLISHEGSAHLSKPTEDIDNILGIKVLEGTIFYWMYLSLISYEISIVSMYFFSLVNMLHLTNYHCVLLLTSVLMCKSLPINKSLFFSYKSHSNIFQYICPLSMHKKRFFFSLKRDYKNNRWLDLHMLHL